MTSTLAPVSAVSLALGLLVLGLLLAGGWRLASRRVALPCPAWLGWLVERDNPLTRTTRAEAIIGHLGLQPGMRVLDVGCGPGRLTIALGRAVGSQGEVTAMDLQAAMLRQAQDKARAAGLVNIHFLRAGAGEGKLDRDRFDRALLVTVLGEIPDQDVALQEVFAALKPGGMLSVTETVFDPHFQRSRAVALIATAVGFREQGCFGNRLAYTLHLEKPAGACGHPGSTTRSTSGVRETIQDQAKPGLDLLCPISWRSLIQDITGVTPENRLV